MYKYLCYSILENSTQSYCFSVLVHNQYHCGNGDRCLRSRCAPQFAQSTGESKSGYWAIQALEDLLNPSNAAYVVHGVKVYELYKAVMMSN